MTVGRSEQAKTLTVEDDWKVFRIVGCVPKVTFFFSDKIPVGKEKNVKEGR